MCKWFQWSIGRVQRVGLSSEKRVAQLPSATGFDATESMVHVIICHVRDGAVFNFKKNGAPVHHPTVRLTHIIARNHAGRSYRVRREGRGGSGGGHRACNGYQLCVPGLPFPCPRCLSIFHAVTEREVCCLCLQFSPCTLPLDPPLAHGIIQNVFSGAPLRP